MSEPTLDEILDTFETGVLLGASSPVGAIAARAKSDAKQALTSLTKELVAEAKPAHVHGTTVSSGQFNRGVSEFEQNLLKALEEL